MTHRPGRQGPDRTCGLPGAEKVFPAAPGSVVLPGLPASVL
ncbi:hypothetical protein [Arsenicibacter rosenii]|nr:hypothetical protein [Arsenicibacter rosenii]